MATQGAEWRVDRERWLEPFLARLSHPARRAMCPFYVAGWIGPGKRKSVQPMAHRLRLTSHDSTVGVRAGASADEGRARARPLRGPLLDGPPPPCPHDAPGRCVLAAPPSRRREARKRSGLPPQPSLPAVRQAIVDHFIPTRPLPAHCPHGRRGLTASQPIPNLPK